MYTCEHLASNLVQDAFFKSSEMHVNINLKSYTSVYVQQQQHVNFPVPVDLL